MTYTTANSPPWAFELSLLLLWSAASALLISVLAPWPDRIYPSPKVHLLSYPFLRRALSSMCLLVAYT
jgi:hypothetical protein